MVDHHSVPGSDGAPRRTAPANELRSCRPARRGKQVGPGVDPVRFPRRLLKLVDLEPLVDGNLERGVRPCVALLIDLSKQPVQYPVCLGLVGGRLPQIQLLAGERIDSGIDLHAHRITAAFDRSALRRFAGGRVPTQNWVPGPIASPRDPNQ